MKEQLLFMIALLKLLYSPLNSITCGDEETTCQSQTIDDIDVNCQGYKACYGSTSITAITSIRCDALSSCSQLNGNITAGTFVTCTAGESCYGNGFHGIIAGTYVACHSQYSCQNNTFITSQSSFVNCQGQLSCSNIHKIGISANSSIFCGGSYSCASSKLISSNNGIYCDGSYSCQSSRIEGIETIYAYGKYSLNNANITSTNTPNNTITINLYGWKAGDGLKITCDHDHICYINCAGNGCYGTELIIDNGTFIVTCNESINIDCPNGYYGPTNQSTFYPTIIPTYAPTLVPTDIPTGFPSSQPSMEPILMINIADNKSSSNNNSSYDTFTELFGNIGFWIILVTIIIIFILIKYIKGLKLQLKSTKKKSLSEQSEMRKVLKKQYEQNDNRRNTDSIGQQRNSQIKQFGGVNSSNNNIDDINEDGIAGIPIINNYAIISPNNNSDDDA